MVDKLNTKFLLICGTQKLENQIVAVFVQVQLGGDTMVIILKSIGMNVTTELEGSFVVYGNTAQGGIITGNLETRLPQNLCPCPKFLVKIPLSS